MRTKQLLTIAMVSLLLIGGVAALGAASPNDAANETATDADDENVPDDAGDEREDRAENTSDEEAVNGTDEADEETSAYDNASAEDAPGPDVDLPQEAPDHVSDVHETINQFLDEEIDNLGEALSELLGDDEDESDA